MSFKDRIEADEIKILRFLNSRMKLAEKDKIRFRNLVKGFEGEVMFDSLTEKPQCPSYILNDLLLETNNGKFQLDTVMITQDPLYLFEVKNYEGDFYFEGDRFYALPKKEYKNPLHQLQRSESLLRQLLESLGYRIPIEAYVVFINPHFTCYKAPLNEPIIYPNQLPRFMHNLNRRPSTLNGMHKKLADQLVSMHQIELPYDRLPPYDYGKLKKGNICRVCLSLKTTVVNNKLVCKDCGCHEVIDHAVLRVVEEIKLLFPNLRITPKVIYDWSQGSASKKTIRRILLENLRITGKTKGSFFE
ncbi:nuclease-related domain-containing protein [Bacillus sp. AFS031507]|uniref:nuclease-related domain-containing protein n=1 Tax=Bacillus sp. AFS031507 TaxID=2033496 RepID=UPI000BFE4943|nr:nuclease-related domain-containing protein [Bacillus sp. AFS031507]PGY15241.1 nuclease [Bacillus sp. AFS031507]